MAQTFTCQPASSDGASFGGGGFGGGGAIGELKKTILVFVLVRMISKTARKSRLRKKKKPLKW